MSKGSWWKLFADPRLDALEAQLDLSNQNIIFAEAQYRQARALVRVARAAYYPTVGIQAAATKVQRPSGLFSTGTVPGGGTAGAGNVFVSSSSYALYSLQGDLSWEIDIWGRVRRSVEANQANAQASAADLESARLSMHAELAQDYLQLRTFDADQRLLDKTADDLQRTLALTENRRASGVASIADVLLAETQLQSTRAQAIDVKVQRSQLEHAIAVLVGKSPAELSLPAMPLDGRPPEIPVGLPSELLERRPDIAAAERRMAAANAQIGVASAAFFPTLTLSATGGFQSLSLSRWLAWAGHFWSAGAMAGETVFQGGLRRAQRDQAVAAYDAAVATYRLTVLTGLQEVEDNLAALHILAEEAKVQDQAVRAADATLATTIEQYRAGLVSYLNVIIAETAALSNQRTAVDILGRRMLATVLLVKALGGGWTTGPF